MKNNKFYTWLKQKAGWSNRKLRHTNMDVCLNCKSNLVPEDSFCRACGQKVHESKLTIWTLISEFFAGIFNLENGFYRSMGRIIFPSFLSKEFIEGRRKKYLNPIRFFVVALLIHLAVINNTVDIERITTFATEDVIKVGQTKVYDQFLARKDSLELQGISTAFLDSMEVDLFQGIRPSSRDTFFFNDEVKISDFQINLGKYGFLRSDVYEMPINELIEKYEVNDFYDRIAATQLIRSIRDVPGAMRFMIGNIVWGVVSSIIIIAFLMQLLYVRRKRYYVEHIIVLCHIHAFAFLVTSFGFLLTQLHFDNNGEATSFFLSGPNPKWIAISYGISVLYFFLAIKNYYGQGWFKSLIKFFVISFTYFVVLIMMLTLILFISLAFFK